MGADCRVYIVVFVLLRFPCYSAPPESARIRAQTRKNRKSLVGPFPQTGAAAGLVVECVSLCLLCRSQIECEGESFVMRLPPRSLSRLGQESDHLHRAGGDKATLN